MLLAMKRSVQKDTFCIGKQAIAILGNRDRERGCRYILSELEFLYAKGSRVKESILVIEDCASIAFQ